jgi:hypothetical protein
MPVAQNSVQRTLKPLQDKGSGCHTAVCVADRGLHGLGHDSNTHTHSTSGSPRGLVDS